MLNRVLKTFFLAPFVWTPEELQKMERIYERVNRMADATNLSWQEWDRGALALADCRLGRHAKALEQLRKADIPSPHNGRLGDALALVVGALSLAQEKDYDKAEEFLLRSDKALEGHDTFSENYDDYWRRDYLYKEARRLIESKEND
jgi:tetratricopeptide (TPR) repeat protein